MKTKTKIKRTRRPSLNRAPRSSYGISADGNTLYRYSFIAHLKQAVKNEGVKPIPSLEYRTKAAEGIKTEDKRVMKVAQPANAAPAAPVQAGATQPDQNFANIVATAVAYALSSRAGMLAGEQPSASRVGHDH